MGPSEAQSRTTGGSPGWVAALILLVALAAFVHGCRTWWPRTVDDTFITFRYSQNFVEGNGPTFNPGDRVEGYSSPSWMFLTAGLLAAGLDPVPATKWLGTIFSLLLLLAFHRSLRTSGVGDRGAALATLLLASSLVLQIWAVSGMETNAYAALLFVGLFLLAHRPDRPAFASSALVLAALTRPEGLMFWGLGLLFALVAARPPARWRAASGYLAPGILLAAHFLWRWSYYGDLLPNTYYVKTGGGPALWRQGWHGLSIFLSDPGHVMWLIAAAAGAFACIAARRGRWAAIMGGAVVLYLLWIVSVGDDGLRVHRFYVPILAPMAFLAGQLFHRDLWGKVPRQLLIGLGITTVVVAAPLSVWKLRYEMAPRMRGGSLEYQEGNEKFGRYLAATRSPDTLVAVASAGAIPYFSKLPTIDMYGLNDRHIARQPFPRRRRGRMMKWDSRYVLSREPDLIVINRGYYRADDPAAKRARLAPATLAVSPMDRDLFEEVSRTGKYALRPLSLDDGSTFFVFERIP